METGKLGLRLAFYGVTAFILAFLGYSTLIFLLAGVALLVEKNEWATRQVIQAFCLCVVSSLISSIFGALDFIYDVPFLGAAYGAIVGVINAVIAIVVLIFCIIGISNNLKGKEANLPLFSKFSNWAFGIIEKKVVSYEQTQYQNTNTPNNNVSYDNAPVNNVPNDNASNNNPQ